MFVWLFWWRAGEETVIRWLRLRGKLKRKLEEITALCFKRQHRQRHKTFFCFLRYKNDALFKHLVQKTWSRRGRISNQAKQVTSPGLRTFSMKTQTRSHVTCQKRLFFSLRFLQEVRGPRSPSTRTATLPDATTSSSIRSTTGRRQSTRSSDTGPISCIWTWGPLISICLILWVVAEVNLIYPPID